jgi:hypothetical protein
MADTDRVYVDTLASQLRTRNPALIAAENELQTLRHFKATVAAFINNPRIALDIRQNLARDLHLPIPENR